MATNQAVTHTVSQGSWVSGSLYLPLLHSRVAPHTILVPPELCSQVPVRSGRWAGSWSAGSDSFLSPVAWTIRSTPRGTALHAEAIAQYLCYSGRNSSLVAPAAM